MQCHYVCGCACSESTTSVYPSVICSYAIQGVVLLGVLFLFYWLVVVRLIHYCVQFTPCDMITAASQTFNTSFHRSEERRVGKEC